MITNIIDLIKVFDSQTLNITVSDNIIKFTKNDKVYNVQISIKKTIINFIPHDKSINTEHFVGILNNANMSNVNQIPDLMEFINNLNLNNYCVVCHKGLDFQSDVFVSCGNPSCLYKYEELIINNTVIEKFNEDSDKCTFLIESAIDAMTCDRKYDIFEPFPQHFLKYETNGLERGSVSKLSGKNYDDVKDFGLIIKTIANFDMDVLLGLVIKCKTDLELSDIIGKNLYILIRFILMSCKVDIVKNDDMLGIKGDKFKIYKIVHPVDKEEEFKNISDNKETHFLFHGSRWCNWYSILRNGLKNCSKTKLMTAGAVYGDGIYLSDDINLSYGYGLSKNNSIVGVFELVDKQTYYKSGVIYVVDNEKILIQRYLLIIPASYKQGFFRDINATFNKKIHQDKLDANIRYNKKSIAKLTREYKMISKIDPDVSGIRVDINPDCIFEWKIFIGKFDKKFPVAQDMEKLGIKEIELEIKFPENYPFSPPFIRVVKPRFMHMTGHIINTGSFCNELLTEKGWSPNYTMESVIVSLASEIVEGGGRIDPHKYNIPYSYEEAKADFIRVAKSHGWM